MKKSTLSFVFSFAFLFSIAQTDMVREINRMNSFNEAMAPLRFLASDELMGRATTRSEIHIAARYISEQFRSFGLKEMAVPAGSLRFDPIFSILSFFMITVLSGMIFLFFTSTIFT